MFELLTGQKPYYDIVAETKVSIVVSHYILPTAPKTGVSPLLPSFRPVLHKCRARDPSDRPTTSTLIKELDIIATSIAAGSAKQPLIHKDASVRGTPLLSSRLP